MLQTPPVGRAVRHCSALLHRKQSVVCRLLFSRAGRARSESWRVFLGRTSELVEIWEARACGSAVVRILWKRLRDWCSYSCRAVSQPSWQFLSHVRYVIKFSSARDDAQRRDDAFHSSVPINHQPVFIGVESETAANSFFLLVSDAAEKRMGTVTTAHRAIFFFF